MNAASFLKTNSSPSDAEIETAMQGNICRCGTYPRIKKAIKQAAIKIEGGKVCHKTTDQEGESGENIEKESFSLVPSAMNQDTEVSKFLGDFMCRRYQPAYDSQPNVDQEGAANRESSDEIVQSISDQNQIGERFFAIALCPMAVVPVEELFQSEKAGEANKNPKIESDGI